MENFVLILINICWIGGLVLISVFSNASFIINSKTKYRRKCLRGGYGYSIKEIRKAIKMTKDKEVITKLKTKILLRKIGYWGFLIGFLLVIILNVFIRN